MFGVTDGKAVGTYLEHKFQVVLHSRYDYVRGSSAKGIDFPKLDVDIKVTSIRQPQSSCPFKSARQKIYGLGYSLIVFVYDKKDDPRNKTSRFNFLQMIFVPKEKAADCSITVALRHMVRNDANIEDILGYFEDHHLPFDDPKSQMLAEEIIKNPPRIGYLTISNLPQWRWNWSAFLPESVPTRTVC